MSTATKIEWTEVTWNPTTGCDRISPGCDRCYALTLAKRLKAMGQAKYQRDGDPRTSGPGFGVTMHADALAEPLRWRTPRTVFVNSMSDISGGVTILYCLKSPAELPIGQFGVGQHRRPLARPLLPRGAVDIHGPSAAGPPAASSGADITHAPIGRSVSIGGRGCPGRCR